MPLEPNARRNLLYIANDNLIVLVGLQNGLTGAYVTNATVTCQVYTSAGATTSGQSWPLTLTYITPTAAADIVDLAEGTDGNYVGTIEDGLSLTAGNYTAKIDVDAGADLIAHFELPVLAKVRTGL